MGWGPLVPDVVHVPSDDVEAVALAMAERPGEVAAVLTEPVQGAGGVYPPPTDTSPTSAACATSTARCSIFDEVITGFGRLGTWFAADHFGVLPDLTTFAKAVTSGYQPLGGVLVGPPVRAAARSGPAYVLRHGYTYSGHPAACAAALANLAIIDARRWSASRRRWAPASATACGPSPPTASIDHARGDGAVWAAGLRADQDATAIRDRMLQRGVITRAIGADTLTFCPPLVITDEQIDRVVDAVATALAERAPRPRGGDRRRPTRSPAPAGRPSSRRRTRRRVPDRRRRASGTRLRRPACWPSWRPTRGRPVGDVRPSNRRPYSVTALRSALA